MEYGCYMANKRLLIDLKERPHYVVPDDIEIPDGEFYMLIEESGPNHLVCDYFKDRDKALGKMMSLFIEDRFQTWMNDLSETLGVDGDIIQEIVRQYFLSPQEERALQEYWEKENER